MANSLVPPTLSSIVKNNDVLQPSKEQEDIALERSRAYWYHIASLAYAYLDHGLPPEFTNPQLALHKIPKLPGRLKSQQELPLGVTPIFALCSPASSTWRISEDPGCYTIKKEITRFAWVQVGTSSAIPYSFCGKVFGNWIGTTSEKTTGPNYLGILTIAWCYILSARLVEMQGDSCTMRYTNPQADYLGDNIYSPPEQTYIIDVGDAGAQIVRWWSAILAKGKGWEAFVKDNKFVSPWTVSRTCEASFVIKQMRDSGHSVQQPLSSDDSFDALLEFARLHRLGSQVTIALTMAMSFPMHRYYGIDAKLPFSNAHSSNTATPDGTPTMWTNLKEDLPYYMTLSCSPEVMISTLCGALWESDIPCNMVTQWLHPVLEEILDDTPEDKRQELIALIGAIRRPTVGALCIGAAVSGMGPKLLQKIQGGRPPLDSVAFPWTGAPQSFMDVSGSGPYTCEDSKCISRPDVWRLLHLPSTEEDDLSYEYRPKTPWEPCGVSRIEACALRVTTHLACSRHEYHYNHWNWELQNGETMQDYGLPRKFPTLTPDELPRFPITRYSFKKKELNYERDASEEASIDIFRWFIVGGEGVPPEKIYHDDLLKEICGQEDDDGEELREASNRNSQEPESRKKERLKIWLDTID